MPPADERFRAQQPAIVETDLRLIEQLELAAFHGPRQLRLQRQPRLQLRPDPAIEKNMAAAAGGLGPIESEVGVAEQLLSGCAVVRIERQPDAGCDVEL